jgi:hypothetical protein
MRYLVSINHNKLTPTIFFDRQLRSGAGPIRMIGEIGPPHCRRPDWEYDEDFGMGHPTLKIDPASVLVHHVRAVQLETTDYLVRRHRWEKHERDF